jgi:hypothetical protein
MFEALAALIRFICEANPEAVGAFESSLMPPFQEVLTRDVADFLPYVFQLLAQLLELRPAPKQGVYCGCCYAGTRGRALDSAVIKRWGSALLCTFRGMSVFFFARLRRGEQSYGRF